MTTEAIQGVVAAVPELQSLQALLPGVGSASGASSVGVPSFGNMVSQGLQQVNQQLKVSQTDLQQLALGNVENLHQIMIRMEESRLSFQLLLQVRNRLLEAYQDVIKMSV